MEEGAPRIESDVVDVLNRELADEEARNNYQDTDDKLVESDVELNSLDGSDDEKENHYLVFNPDVDFKGKVNLSLGLKFPSNNVFKKALRHHAIENGYNYYYLHNGGKRVSVYCFNKCGCNRVKGKFKKCSCTQKKMHI